jgi:uncharacterized protein YndB with AHSA1/START domain
MAKAIDLRVVFDAPIERVWAELSDLASHPDWMSDAGSVEFLTDSRRGVGTQMMASTRVGPLRATDRMDVVEWVEGRVIGVEHVGSVKGTGRFEIQSAGQGTELRWIETLIFPWWLGGPLGELVARPILTRIWRGSLEKLRARVELSGP